MRIALVIDRFDRRRGGAQQWTYDYANWLLCQGCEIHVLSREFGTAERELGIVAHMLPGAGPAFSRAVEARLSVLRPDITHDMGATWCGDFFQPHFGSRTANRLRNAARLPAWKRWSKQQLARYLPAYRRREAFAARQFRPDQRTFVALSHMVAADLQRYHGIPADQIHTVYNGVNTLRFHPLRRRRYRDRIRRQLRIEEHETAFLIVAHNFGLKGVPQLVRAIERLRAEGEPVRLLVCGGDARRFPSARREGRDGCIWFLGPVNDPAPYYAAADAYAHPTYYDACSLVVLEALASGLPVLTTCYNGASELLTAGREGYVLTNPGDVGELTSFLQLLLSAERRRAFGRAARTLAERHTDESNFRRLFALYEQKLVSRGFSLRAA